MDRSQLTTIVVTVVITAIARELLNWIISFAKSSVATEKTKAKARKIFNIHTFAAIWNISWLACSVWLLIFNIRKNAPISRFDVFVIAFWSIASLFQIAVSTFNLARAIETYKSGSHRL
jgi:hypothetical protein